MDKDKDFLSGEAVMCWITSDGVITQLFRGFAREHDHQGKSGTRSLLDTSCLPRGRYGENERAACEFDVIGRDYYVQPGRFNQIAT